MKINHEDTKNTKEERKNLRKLRFFVVDFLKILLAQWYAEL